MRKKLRETSIPQNPEADQLRTALLHLYAELIVTDLPARSYIGGFLRRRKEIRGSARNFLASAAFSMLRNRSLTLHCAGMHEEPDFFQTLEPIKEAAFALRRWLESDLAAGPELAAQLLRKAAEAAGELWRSAAEDALKGTLPSNPPPQWRVPPGWFERWANEFDNETAQGLALSACEPAPFHLRVNESNMSRKDFLSSLAKAGVAAEPLRYSPSGVLVHQKSNLKRAPLVRESYEVQDEGSQLVSLAIGEIPNGPVLDACAGGGGKTVHLRQLYPGRRIFAHDQESSRMDDLRTHPLAKSITLLEAGSAGASGPYAAILIDAPCLGHGRLRREPSLAWRGDFNLRAEEAARAQRQCLEEYAPLLATGGILVYAVCSFESCETHCLIEDFLRAHQDFEKAPLPALFSHPQLQRFQDKEHSMVWLLPPTHGCDGFTIARLRRRGPE